MAFFEDLAAALDAEGIESRGDGDTLFVPITSELEIQFVEIDPLLPAANVYIANSDIDEDDNTFEAVLVSVVFSVEDAVKAVGKHMATDQIVTILKDLIGGTDERIADLDFQQSYLDPHVVSTPVGQDSVIRVEVEAEDDVVPVAEVFFIAYPGNVDDDIVDDAEILELGKFTDFDRLFDALSLAADQAEEWEAQLLAFDDDDDFDDYQDFGESFEDDLEDDSEDE
ncbi:hypothetical protein ACX3U9_08825 [Corynebacterium pyruviciproducens]